jgi:hypothetical protein
MALPELPRLQQTIYEDILPSTGKRIKFRPFTVKEEKILLTAKESRDPAQILLAIQQILTNCIIGADVKQLSVIDAEFIMMKIRGKSVGAKSTFIVEDPDTQEEVKLVMDFDKIHIDIDPRHSNKVKLDDKHTILLRHPPFDSFGVAFDPSRFENALEYFEVVIDCIEGIVSADGEVFELSQYPRQQQADFLESLDARVLEDIHLFFETIPKLQHRIDYENSQGTKRTFVVEGMEGFFM